MKVISALLTAFLWCLLMLASITIKAQFVPSPQFIDKFKVLDSCLYRIYYDVRIQYPTPEKSIPVNDIHRLEIGTSIAKCSSYLLYEKDSASTVMRDKGMDVGVIIQQMVFPVETCVDRKLGSTSLVYRTFFSGPILRYRELNEDIRWEIALEVDSILSFPCQKATCLYRGRSYTAWFTLEIPLGYGPYKFGGLPGLILKIYDDDNQYSWICTRIEKAQKGETIKEYKWNYDDVNKQKMDATIVKMHENPFKFCESLGMKFMVRSNGSYGERVADISIPYSPLEK